MTIKPSQEELRKPMAVYHFWSHPNEPAPYKNLRTPIILSIASLRAVSKMPITVLDITERNVDWGDFPSILNFKVVSQEPQLKKYKDTVHGWQYLSRIYDINHWMKTCQSCCPIMYVDSDVFWIRNPEPFHKNPSKFVFDGWNSGFFYYDFNSENNERFFEIFDAYTRGAIFSDDIRTIVKKYVGYDSWHGVWDEMILTYMTHKHPELFDLTNANEHSTARVLKYVNKESVKMFHCNGTMVENTLTRDKHSRGLLGLLVKEFHKNITKSLTQEHLNLIFSQQEQEYYLGRQFSLFDDLDRLLATRDELGHFNVKSMISAPTN